MSHLNTCERCKKTTDCNKMIYSNIHERSLILCDDNCTPFAKKLIIKGVVV